MKNFYIGLFFILSGFVVSCADKDQPAKERLNIARQYLAQGEFEKAKAEIDSINVLHKKSFDQRRDGMALLDSIRRAENSFTLESSTTLLAELTPVLEKMKADFVYQRNEKYQDAGQGVFVPKATSDNSIGYTTLRSGVMENGMLYIESVFIGAQRHNKIVVSATDGTSSESLAVIDDGVNYRFTDMGKTYEIIRFLGPDDNGVARFISENKTQVLKVALQGKQTSSYTLPLQNKEAISKSYNLALQMQMVDSLKNKMEEVGFREFYLDNGKKTQVPVE